jgi:hypothetical protein
MSANFGSSRQSEAEGAARPELRLHPNLAARSLHDLLADRQPDARSLDLTIVRALKQAKHLVLTFEGDGDSVVSNANQPFRE